MLPHATESNLSVWWFGLVFHLYRPATAALRTHCIALRQIEGSSHFNLRFNVTEWLCASKTWSLKLSRRALLPPACEEPRQVWYSNDENTWKSSLQKRLTYTFPANFADNVFQSIMPDEEAGRDTGIFEDELEIKNERSCRQQICQRVKS